MIGSSDATPELLERAAQNDPRLVLISFSRNFGHQTALAASLDHASGDVTILMDGDLQDPPEAIPRLLDWYNQGYDVVYVRRVKQKESWWLRLCYYIFYRLLAVLSSTRLPVDAGRFQPDVPARGKGNRKMPEHHRYLRGLRTWVGFRQIGVPIERSARAAGRTKYAALKLLKLAFDEHLRLLHCSVARRCHSGSVCRGPFHVLRGLLDSRQVPAAVSLPRALPQPFLWSPSFPA